MMHRVIEPGNLDTRQLARFGQTNFLAAVRIVSAAVVSTMRARRYWLGLRSFVVTLTEGVNRVVRVATIGYRRNHNARLSDGAGPGKNQTGEHEPGS